MVRRSFVLLVLLAAGCAPQVRLAVAPDVLSTGWREAPAAGAAETVGSERLAEVLHSAELRRLTDRALAANTDIAVAAARIERARAELGSARAAMLPVISGSAGIGATRTDDKNDSLYRFSEGFAGLDISYD